MGCTGVTGRVWCCSWALPAIVVDRRYLYGEEPLGPGFCLCCCTEYPALPFVGRVGDKMTMNRRLAVRSTGWAWLCQGGLTCAPCRAWSTAARLVLKFASSSSSAPALFLRLLRCAYACETSWEQHSPNPEAKQPVVLLVKNVGALRMGAAQASGP